jgi:two-component system OmpR family sensor kinase
MTIRLRLTIYWAAVLAAILLVAAVAAVKFFERQQSTALEAALLEEADTMAKEIERADPAAVTPLLIGLSRETDIGPQRRVRLSTASGKIIGDYGDVHTKPLPVGSPPPTKARIMRNEDDRIAIAPLRFSGEPAFLESGVSVNFVETSVSTLRNSLILLMPLLLLLCVAGGYWLAGRALMPIESVTSALDAIQPNSLSARLPLPGVSDEVARLATVINRLLERLERASATERRFASDAAHEMRTPLAVLRTGLEVSLGRTRTAAEGMAALDAAHREVLALCKITDELLLLARLNGEVSVDRSRVDLRDLLNEIAATVEPLAQAREIQLNVVAPSDAIVDANPGHLRRLVINLLDNALKFTPEQGAIELALAHDARHAMIKVADNGPGIAPSEMPLIFDRFFRGAAAPGDGSGLGLSLCKEIARLHGGEIVAVNRPAGGAEFIVTLPLAARFANRVSA